LKKSCKSQEKPKAPVLSPEPFYCNRALVESRMHNTHRLHPESGRLLPIVSDVVGKGVEEATALLKERGFRVVEPPEDPEGFETDLAGTVPAADTLADPRATIRLVRAAGPSESS
jgi:beta-lactam-binding protein with PASTA domain